MKYRVTLKLGFYFLESEMELNPKLGPSPLDPSTLGQWVKKTQVQCSPSPLKWDEPSTFCGNPVALHLYLLAEI